MNRSEITIHPVKGDELAEQWAGERDPQPVYAVLYLRSGVLCFEVSGQVIGDSATSADVYYGIERRYPISTALDAETANEVLADIEPLAQRVLDGAEIVTDPAGSTCAVLTDDASEADDEIGALLEGYDETSLGAITAATCASYEIDWDTIGITRWTPDGVTAWTADQELHLVAEELTDGVRESGVVLVDALESVTVYRDELLDEHVEAVSQARDDEDDDALTNLLLTELRCRDAEWNRKTQEGEDQFGDIENTIRRYATAVATVDGEAAWYAVIAGEVYRVEDNHGWDISWPLGDDDIADLDVEYRVALGLAAPPPDHGQAIG